MHALPYQINGVEALISDAFEGELLKFVFLEPRHELPAGKEGCPQHHKVVSHLLDHQQLLETFVTIRVEPVEG